MDRSKYYLLVAICWLSISLTVCEEEDATQKIGSTAQQFAPQTSCGPPKPTDCDSLVWKPFNQLAPNDNLEYAGYDAVSRQNLIICRFPVQGQMAVGKGNRDQQSCWVAVGRDGIEVGSSGSQNFEVLVNPGGIKFNWTETTKGAILPTGSIEGFHDGDHFNYVARCKWVSQWGDEVTPGPLHRDFFGITVRAMYFPFSFRAHECTGSNWKIEVLTCTEF